MIDYKSSQVDILDDVDNMRLTDDCLYPSRHYRFYCENSFLYIARCNNEIFRLLSNFYPKKSLYTYNGIPFNIYRYHKHWCLCDSDKLFDVKRSFVIYVNKLVRNVTDSMFSFQPVFEF